MEQPDSTAAVTETCSGDYLCLYPMVPLLMPDRPTSETRKSHAFSFVDVQPWPGWRLPSLKVGGIRSPPFPALLMHFTPRSVLCCILFPPRLVQLQATRRATRSVTPPSLRPPSPFREARPDIHCHGVRLSVPAARRSPICRYSKYQPAANIGGEHMTAVTAKIRMLSRFMASRTPVYREK